MPPLHRGFSPRLAMNSRAKKNRRRRRAMRLHVLVVPLCLLSAVTALALRLAFCDAQSTRLGYAKTRRAAGHLQHGTITASTGSRGLTGQRGQPACMLQHCRVEAGCGSCVDSSGGRFVPGELDETSRKAPPAAARLPEERGRNAFVLSTWGWTARHHRQGEGRQAADTTSSARGSRNALLSLRPAATTMVTYDEHLCHSFPAASNCYDVVHTSLSPRPGTRNGRRWTASYRDGETSPRRLYSKGLGGCSDSGTGPSSSREAVFLSPPARRGVSTTLCVGSAEDADEERLETPPSPAGAEAAARRSPLIITIGPQCAGKTTLLRSLAARAGTRGDTGGDAESMVPTVTDVAIDDHPSVRQRGSIFYGLQGCPW